MMAVPGQNVPGTAVVIIILIFFVFWFINNSTLWVVFLQQMHYLCKMFFGNFRYHARFCAVGVASYNIFTFSFRNEEYNIHTFVCACGAYIM